MLLVEAYAAEIGGELSQADWTLVRQAASLMLAAERLSGDIVKGAAIDPDALIRINSEARRVLGLLRSKSVKAKPAAPTILDYVDELAALSKYDRSSLDHRDIADDLLRSIPTLLFLQRNIWAKSSVGTVVLDRNCTHMALHAG